MSEIKQATIGRAHEEVVRLILDEGLEQRIETEPGKVMLTWELPEPLLTLIEEPWREPKSSLALPYGPKMLEKYSRDLLTVGKTEFSYTYANRLFDYPDLFQYDGLEGKPEAIKGNGLGGGIDQIDSLVNELRKSLASRRAIAITWVPQIDAGAVEPPCLQFVHFLWRNGGLHLRAAFRSHDMLLGAGPNWIALEGLRQHVAGRVLQPMTKCQWSQSVTGSLSTLSSSAHIYVEAQSNELRAFKRVLGIS